MFRDGWGSKQPATRLLCLFPMSALVTMHHPCQARRSTGPRSFLAGCLEGDLHCLSEVTLQCQLTIRSSPDDQWVNEGKIPFYDCKKAQVLWDICPTTGGVIGVNEGAGPAGPSRATSSDFVDNE